VKTIVRLLILLAVVLPFTLIRPDIPLEDLTARYSDDRSRFVDIDEMPVHYKIEGTGPPLLLLHGTGASLHTWDAWTREMKGNFKVIRLDLPAFGLTGPTPDNTYSYEGYARFLDRFVRRLQLNRFALAGNSLGGAISWHYALAHPEKVTRLVLIDAGGYPGKSPPIFTLARLPVLGRLITVITPRFMVKKNLREVYGDPSRITSDLVDRYYDLLRRRGNREAMLARIRTMEYSNHEAIRRVTTPTLILWGESDRWIPVDNARRFHNDIAGSTLIVYPGLGHVPMEEAPRITARDARSFLLSGQL